MVYYTIVLNKINISFTLNSKLRSKTICTYPISFQNAFSIFNYATDKSTALNEQVIRINKLDYICLEYADTITLNNNITFTWNYYQPKHSDFIAEMPNVVGFGYDMNNTLVYQLKSQGIINKAIFALCKHTSNNGTIYLGDVSTEMKRNKRVIMQDINEIPGLFIESISFGKHMFNCDKSYFRLEADGGVLIVPERFFKEINNTLFDEYYLNNVCEYVSNGNSNSFNYKIECKERIVDMFHNEMKLKINDNNSIVLQPIDLFHCYNEKCYFTIYPHINHNNNEFILGTRFITLFDIVEFNYEKEGNINPHISMYSDKYIYNNTNINFNKNITQKGYCLIICILIYGIYILLLIKRKLISNLNIHS